MSYRPRRVKTPEITDAPRVAVVGHCGAGKSTLVAGLRERGIDAVASAQEHSVVTDLWRRTRADLLIYLQIDLETIRGRRGKSWSEAIYDVQESRLARARSSADIVIDTGTTELGETLATAERFVIEWREEQNSESARNTG
jgi:broad-specificity NMP kinase